MLISRQKPGIKKPANEAKNEEALSSFSKRLNMKPVKVLTDKTKGLDMASRIPNVIGIHYGTQDHGVAITGLKSRG